jgi:DnaJ-class molecular chaperone
VSALDSRTTDAMACPHCQGTGDGLWDPTEGTLACNFCNGSGVMDEADIDPAWPETNECFETFHE